MSAILMGTLMMFVMMAVGAAIVLVPMLVLPRVMVLAAMGLMMMMGMVAVTRAATTMAGSDVVPPLVPPGPNPPDVLGRRGGGTRWRGHAAYRMYTRTRARDKEPRQALMAEGATRSPPAAPTTTIAMVVGMVAGMVGMADLDAAVSTAATTIRVLTGAVNIGLGGGTNNCC